MFSDVTNAKANETVIWYWNAIRYRGVYDCRLCLPTRPRHIWASCQKQCSNIPSDLLAMKRIMEVQWKKGLDEEFKRWQRYQKSSKHKG